MYAFDTRSRTNNLEIMCRFVWGVKNTPSWEPETLSPDREARQGDLDRTLASRPKGRKEGISRESYYSLQALSMLGPTIHGHPSQVGGAPIYNVGV